MKMYDLIAKNYSQIFPVEDDKVNFIKETCLPHQSKIIDAGCATGDLTLRLHTLGYQVLGFDLNEMMIEIAKAKSAKLDSGPSFNVLNMLNIEQMGLTDHVLCFGNTLPHLSSQDEIKRFFFSVNKVLHDNGSFIFQILNYDRILRERAVNFKVIENEDFRFTRNYTFFHDDRISFNIEMVNKLDQKAYSDSTILLPLKRDSLLLSLKKAGFSFVEVYSDFNKTLSDQTEFSSIYRASKTAHL